MRLIAWNCRGLAQPTASRSLRALERKFPSNIVFLSETKVSASHLFLDQLGFVNSVEWPADRRQGGVILAWKNGWDIEVTKCSENMISAVVHSNPPSLSWLLAGVYALTECYKKASFWEDFEIEVENFHGPWVGLGDFNFILMPDDKQGGRVFASSSVGDLRCFMDQSGLLDLGSLGLPYTWKIVDKARPTSERSWTEELPTWSGVSCFLGLQLQIFLSPPQTMLLWWWI